MKQEFHIRSDNSTGRGSDFEINVNVSNSVNARCNENHDNGYGTPTNSSENLPFVKVHNGLNATNKNEVVGIPINNRFGALPDEVEYGSYTLACDALRRDEGKLFCRNIREKCFEFYPGAKTNDVVERGNEVIDHSQVDSAFAAFVDADNLRGDRGVDILNKYRKVRAARRGSTW